MRRLTISEISETGITEPTMWVRQSQPAYCFQTKDILTKMIVVEKDFNYLAIQNVKFSNVLNSKIIYKSGKAVLIIADPE